MARGPKKLTSRIDPDEVRRVIDEALREFTEMRKSGDPRPEVLRAFCESLAEFESLYRGLAK